MTVKCTKCIDHFREKRRRLELIHDLKAKNEGTIHASLKNETCNIIRKLGREKFPDWSTSVETEVLVEGIGRVDVLGRIGEVTIAVECGNTNPKKILALEEEFDVVLHIPFCYTLNFVDLDMDEITHQIVVALIEKGLETRGLTKGLQRNKPICLEEGECSLPSGRDGFPEEARQIAGFYVDQDTKHKKKSEKTLRTHRNV